jgi:hypothetical protein
MLENLKFKIQASFVKYKIKDFFSHDNNTFRPGCKFFGLTLQSNSFANQTSFWKIIFNAP